MLLNLNLRKAILRGCIECLCKRFMLQFIRFVYDFRAFLEIYCLLNFLILKSLLHHEVRWYLIEHIELFNVFILPLLLLLFIPFFGVFLKLLRHNDRLSDTWDVGGGSLNHRQTHLESFSNTRHSQFGSSALYFNSYCGSRKNYRC